MGLICVTILDENIPVFGLQETISESPLGLQEYVSVPSVDTVPSLVHGMLSDTADTSSLGGENGLSELQKMESVLGLAVSGSLFSDERGTFENSLLVASAIFNSAILLVASVNFGKADGVLVGA